MSDYSVKNGTVKIVSEKIVHYSIHRLKDHPESSFEWRARWNHPWLKNANIEVFFNSKVPNSEVEKMIRREMEVWKEYESNNERKKNNG